MTSLPLNLSPLSITRIERGFLVMDRDRGIVLDPTMKSVAEINLRQTNEGLPTGIESLYSNWVTRDATFLGFGAVLLARPWSEQYDPSRGFELGFIRGKISAVSGRFSDVELLQATEDNDLYLLGFPYFAANDDGLFFVRMVGGRAAIIRVRDTAPVLEELTAFPDRFRAITKLKPGSGPSTTAPRFAEIEKSRMAVGLFGQGTLLYLLAREPGTHGDQMWLLFQISPQVSTPLGVVRLPTTANHLTVVPGPDYWYLFERGAVRGWGKQEIKTLVRVPARWITSPSTSPLKGLHLAECRRSR